MHFSLSLNLSIKTTLVGFTFIQCVCARQVAEAPNGQGEWRIVRVGTADRVPQIGKPAEYSAVLKKGAALSPEAAQALEASLKSAPDVLNTHLQLLSYYAMRDESVHDPEARSRRIRELQWLVANHPRLSVFHSLPPLTLSGLRDPNDPRVVSMKSAWEKQLEANPNDPRILENAEACLQMVDFADSVKYLKRLRQIEPTFPHVALSLALLYTQAITRMVDPHGPAPSPADGFGPMAKVDLEQSSDVPVLGYSGEMLYLLGHMNGASKPSAAIGETLLKRAEGLDPSNPHWRRALARTSPPSVGMIVAIISVEASERDLWPGGTMPEFGPAEAVHLPPDVAADKLVHTEAPDYPLAERGFNHGTVRLRSLIGPDGRIQELEVIDGPMPVLPRVIDAVRNWTYTPAVVNGKPAEAVTDIALEFSAAGSPPRDAAGALGGVVAAAAGGVVAGVPPPPPLPPGPSGTAPDTVRVGGKIAEANLIKKVQPIYPPAAKAARVQGTVVFTAVIAKDGTIQNLQLVQGHPLLVDAARNAILQWQYRPMLFNGRPVSVVTDVIVNFTLSR